MTDEVQRLVGEIRTLERALEAEYAKRRAGMGFGLALGRIRFEQDIIRRHRRFQRHVAAYLLTAKPLFILTSPVIYSLILPFVLLDAWVSFYQAICFRVYGIPQVRRSPYMVFDRAGLAYLNAIEKLNCAYCSYVNGLIAYVREVGARTEQYWCPIKHARRVFGAHTRYGGFAEYGDGEAYRASLHGLRADLDGDEGQSSD
jgi:hypothetical protein